MQATETADVVIAGAGCAGLSLAVHLVHAGITNRRILLLDPRAVYQRDRTWCFWDVGGATLFDDAVTHSWKQWRVIAADGEEISRHSERFAYRHLPADRFYNKALDILSGFPNVELRLNCSVDAVADEGRLVRVCTSSGEILAPVVFDSRPRRYGGKESIPTKTKNRRSDSLLQHFLGVTVRADNDIFDPATVTLMDFRIPQEKGIHFLYLLPFSPREALVETTYISPCRLTREEYLSSLQSYCAAYFPKTTFTFIGEETGVIPMRCDATPRQNGPRILMAGIAGGMAKPSTGYAFLAIQRWSQQVARQMAQGVKVPSPPAPRSRRAAVTDKIFLAYLRQHPKEAPALFARLFRSTPADSLLRFLGDTGSVLDDMKVIQSLPKSVFLKQAFHEILFPEFPSPIPFTSRWGRSV